MVQPLAQAFQKGDVEKPAEEDNYSHDDCEDASRRTEAGPFAREFRRFHEHRRSARHPRTVVDCVNPHGLFDGLAALSTLH
jgi:hypothetical protein